MATAHAKLIRVVSELKKTQKLLDNLTTAASSDAEAKHTYAVAAHLSECCGFAVDFFSRVKSVPADHWVRVLTYRRIMGAVVDAMGFNRLDEASVAKLAQKKVGPSDEEVKDDPSLGYFLPMRAACESIIDGFDGYEAFGHSIRDAIRHITRYIVTGLSSLKQEHQVGVANTQKIMRKLTSRLSRMDLTEEEERRLDDAIDRNKNTELYQSLSELADRIDAPSDSIVDGFPYYKELCDLWLAVFADPASLDQAMFQSRAKMLGSKLENCEVAYPSDFLLTFMEFAMDMLNTADSVGAAREKYGRKFNDIIEGVKVIGTIVKKLSLVKA